MNIIANPIMLQRADATRIEIISPERPHEMLELNTYNENREEA